MLIESAFVSLVVFQREWPAGAELQTGEVLRSYERTMSRRGTYERIVVLTPSKVFVKDGDVRHFAMLTPMQKNDLKAIFFTDPSGLRAKKRSNPMWPSAYDGTDHWLAYRVGALKRTWTNETFEFPPETDPLARFLESIRTQFSS